MNRALLLSTILMLTLWGAGSHARRDLPAPRGDTPASTAAAPLAWSDISGRRYGTADLSGAKATVFFFASMQCPISGQYTPRMVEAARDYAAKGVRFFLVDSNVEDSPAALARYAKGRNIPFPVVKDSGTTLADRLDAQATPSAIVVDSAGAVRYMGRIDDGIDRGKITRQDLRLALDSLLAGQTIARPRTRVVGCAIFRDKAAAAPVKVARVTYAHDIAPILYQNCVSCHRAGEAAPFALQTYAQAKTWASAIKDYTGRRIMPPWKAVPEQSPLFHDARFLTDTQLGKIATWADTGAPLGNPKEIPDLPKMPAPGDWSLGKPDVVASVMRPFHLEAEGRDVYRDFTLPIDFTQDRYVAAMDFHPGNRAVVHHIIAYIDRDGKTCAERDNKETEPGWSVAGGGSGIENAAWGRGWAPGMTARRYAAGIALRIPKGAKLVLQVHYHKTGRPEVDQSKIALYYAKEPVQKRVETAEIGSPFIALKPNVANQVVNAQITSPVAVTVYEAMPHMHMLGKEMEVTAKLPDGTMKPIIHVTNWDFNWQIGYRYKEPIHLPAGTKILLRAVYDNTATNPNQPSNPPVAVHFGENTTDEMCFAFLAFTVDSGTPMKKAGL